MNIPVSKYFVSVILILISFSGFLLISHDKQSLESTLSRREVPALDLSLSTFKETMEQANDPLVVPTVGKQSEDSAQTEAGWDRRLQILGERAKPSPQSLCEEVAIGMQAFTKELSAGGSTPSMDKISDVKWIADYRRIFPFPNPGEKVVVLQCRAVIQYSIKIEADTDFYLLIDSDSNTRVRYEPNNETSRKIP